MLGLRIDGVGVCMWGNTRLDSLFTYETRAHVGSKNVCRKLMRSWAEAVLRRYAALALAGKAINLFVFSHVYGWIGQWHGLNNPKLDVL